MFFIKNPIANEIAATLKLIVAISKNLFLNETSFTTETKNVKNPITKIPIKNVNAKDTNWFLKIKKGSTSDITVVIYASPV